MSDQPATLPSADDVASTTSTVDASRTIGADVVAAPDAGGDPDQPVHDDASGADGVSDADVAIRVSDLHIHYQAVTDKKQTLRGRVSRLGRRRPVDATHVVKAVRGVTFDVHRGEVLGIIGHNGAGKSTMLRGIAGILPPSAGQVEVAGHVSTLLALGVGFNAKLSGRENILVGGLAAGLTRQEVAAREDAIVEFAGVGEFLDMPLRTYSSGMRGRLAFAVATSLDPDILLIDEALSAGDNDFRDKAADRMRELLGQGRTIVLVSHGMRRVEELSDRVLWLSKGRIVEIGDPGTVIEHYKDERGGRVGAKR